jgi:ABC-2 type transport system permease protein
MAWLLVQLKIRILRNALRSSRRARISFIVSTSFAVLVAIGTFVGLALLRDQSARVAETAAIFTVFAFGWLILPLLAFGLDSTLDPATIALYPIRTRPLAGGLLAASATGAWSAANVIGLLGVTVGVARGGLGIVVAVIAVVLQVLFCIALARLVTTSLAGMLRSRRGKDLVAFLIIPLFALYETFAQVVPRLAAEGKITDQTFAHIDAWLRWLPPGLAAHAIADASDGRPGTALLRLALLAAIVVVLALLWVRSLGRALVSVDTSTQSSAVRRTSLPFPRAGIRGTVAARYLIYQRREPTSIIRWCIIGVVMLAASVSTIRTPQYHVGLFLSAMLAGMLLCVYNANLIGITGAAFATEATALTGVRALRAYFGGHNLTLAVIALPLTVSLSFVLAAAAGHPLDGFLAAAIDAAAIGAGLGLSSIYTAEMAFPTQKRVGSPFPGTADGYSGQALAAAFSSLFGVALAALPVIFAIEFSEHAAAAIRLPVLLPAAAAYGLLLAWGGTRIAALATDRKLPELVQIAMLSKI